MWACVLGLLVFAAWGGLHIVSPAKVGWLLTGLDTRAHYLGWESFRTTPWWQWPIGANPGYGSDAPATVVLADAIPALAIAFKAFDRVLPAGFQYFGVWLACCFVLQAWYGSKLVGCFTGDAWLRLLGAGFFAIATIFLIRPYLHPALAGQWILLAALYFCFDDRKRHGAWIALLVFASLVHAYLLTMAGAIWAADVAARLIRCKVRPLLIVRHVLLVLISVVLTMWAAGYFVPVAVVPQPFRSYTNLLTPIWTGVCRSDKFYWMTKGDWSWFVPCMGLDFDVMAKASDGFGYFGIGFILLLPVALACAVLRRARPFLRLEWLTLSLAAVVMLVYAVGNLVYAGNRLLFSYRQPALVGHLADVFHGAARMEWPAWYLVLTATLAAVVGGMRVPAARWVLGVALLVQCIDLSRGAVINHAEMVKGAHYSNQLLDPAWSQLASHYQHVVFMADAHIPAKVIAWIPGYVQVARYAVLHRMTINQAYLARLDEAALARAREARVAELLDGKSESSTIYVIGDVPLWSRVLCAPEHGQWRGSIDGFQLVIPDPRWTPGLPPAESCHAATAKT